VFDSSQPTICGTQVAEIPGPSNSDILGILKLYLFKKKFVDNCNQKPNWVRIPRRIQGPRKYLPVVCLESGL
jgi:hypothetical protein